MRVDPLLPRAEKITLVLEAIGDDKVRVNSTGIDNPLVTLEDRAIEIVDREAASWMPSAQARGIP